jgi:hypothetical protein
MAMQLVVATTEATDPTRVRVPFRTTANVSEVSSMRVRGAARGVTEEVRAGEIVHHVSPRHGTPPNQWISRVQINGEGGK